MKKKHLLFGLLASLLLALILSPFASRLPDGLERVAEDKGFLEKGEVKPIIPSPIPDYSWPGLKNEKLATSFAGMAGTLIVFGISYGIAALIKKK
ncbi:MAG: hypothetical protein GXO98_06510 [Nitrospirae bacterium]|nr:hypothetical protein [Nitrospirota bacterium]